MVIQVITKTFLYNFSVYSCHLSLIFYASLRSISFLSFIVSIFAWNVPLISFNFLEEISSLFHSIVFFFFFSLITEEDFLISLCYALELRIQIGLSFLFSFAFCFSSFTAICKASSDCHFAFLNFFFLGTVLIPSPVQCHKPLSIVLQACCLSDLIPWIDLWLLLYNHKGFDLGHTWMV